ncbi:mitochondrial peripheral inner membrane protein [Podospora pseudopauciseta]|uniref:Mitochondrial peripheral inner membrane protein n=1 Tax=Podospora pseudopauciseta TaxID=2093780 RepID=A0ABR0HQF7_9PEZI|nr:mitochondrial peripheral inner membrane protein [Podospora pseudopauciseta]
MSGRLVSSGIRLPKHVAGDGRLNLMKISLSSHAQRQALQRIYTQRSQHRQFHVSPSQAAKSRFDSPKSEKDESRFAAAKSKKNTPKSTPEPNAAQDQEEPRVTRKEVKRERTKILLEQREQRIRELEAQEKERLEQEKQEEERAEQERQELKRLVKEQLGLETENPAKEEKSRSEQSSNVVRNIFFSGVASAGALVLWEMWRFAYSTEPLNDQKFSPFEIVDRQQVSPTAFIVTVKPVVSRLGGLASQWKLAWLETLQHKLAREGTWAVEIKQPELQVARDYTPLPELDVLSATNEYDTRGRIELFQLLKGLFSPQQSFPTFKFLIRRTEGGEVSSWLSRRKVGDTIELRGPHQSFNVVARAGYKEAEEPKRVVFLAGGTGIAPALQAAGSLFREHGQTLKKMPQFDIIWANRSKEDIKTDNPVIELLEKLKEMSRGKINYVCVVDEEGRFITANDIVAKTQITPPRKSWFWNSSKAESTPSKEDVNCYYHSSKHLITSAGEDYEKVDGENPRRQCACPVGRPSFKNLLMVSGPEGFNNYFAGPKYWADGKERQGPVGGVIGELAKKYPSLASDWLVLKL